VNTSIKDLVLVEAGSATADPQSIPPETDKALRHCADLYIPYNNNVS